MCIIFRAITLSGVSFILSTLCVVKQNKQNTVCAGLNHKFLDKSLLCQTNWHNVSTAHPITSISIFQINV